MLNFYKGGEGVMGEQGRRNWERGQLYNRLLLGCGFSWQIYKIGSFKKWASNLWEIGRSSAREEFLWNYGRVVEELWVCEKVSS